MRSIVFLTGILVAVSSFSEVQYRLTVEELEAGFAIRDENEKSKDASMIGDLGASSVQPVLGNADMASGSSWFSGFGGFGNWLPSSLTQIVQAALPVLQIAAQVTLGAMAAAAVIKVAEVALVAATTAVCNWLGFDLATSVTAGLLAPVAVTSTVSKVTSWIKGRIFA